MKFLHAAAFAVALTLTSVPALSAQQPDQDKEKPKQDEKEKKQPANKDKDKDKEKEKPQTKPDDRANPKPQPDKEKPGHESDRREQQPQRQDDRDRARQEDRSATHEQAERNEAHHGGGHRIPEERFRASFGEEHHFRVARRSDRRFEYSGYSFEYVDAWPSDWSYDDDVYIVLIGDDYYLVDANHPGVRIRLIIAE
jgi:hypothetical protein